MKEAVIELSEGAAADGSDVGDIRMRMLTLEKVVKLGEHGLDVAGLDSVYTNMGGAVLFVILAET